MANKFVWHGATGLADGTTWADAYTDIRRDWSGEITPATDFVYVRSVHTQTDSSDGTITGSAVGGTTVPVRIVTVVGNTTGTVPGNLATGANIQTTGTTIDIFFAGGLYFYGVNFLSTNELSSSGSGDIDFVFEQCRLELLTNSGLDGITLAIQQVSVSNQVRFLGCTFAFANTSQGFEAENCTVIMDGCTLEDDVLLLYEIIASGERADITINNTDLSVLTGAVVDNDSAATWTLKISRCLFHASTTLVNGDIANPGTRAASFHCQDGTDSNPAFQMEIQTDRGSVITDEARRRNGGASDGERTDEISWDMSTAVGSKRQYPGYTLQSPPIVGWTPGDGATAHVYRIYFASGGTQQDDDIWFELDGPNDAATNSLGVRNTKRVDPETAAGDHDTDSVSTWDGTDVTTLQQMDITYTPDKPGPISAIVHMVTDAGGTGHIYIDPKIYVDP